MYSRILTLVGLFALGITALSADTVTLKNGSVLTGTYKGGTETMVTFEAMGNIMQIARTEIVTLTIGAAPAPAAAAPAPAPAPVPAPAPAPAPVATSLTIPYGTPLVVRMTDSISSRDAAGTTFTARLEYNLVVDGMVVMKAGTPVSGKVESSTQARRAAGRSTLDIRLVTIAPGGNPIPISTSGYAEEGASSGGKVVRAAAVGAIIGNNTGSGSQGDGAAIGAGVAMMKKGESIEIPTGTVLEFTLQQPVTLSVVR